MADEQDVTGSRQTTGVAAGVFPGWALIVGLVVFAAAGLGLATLGAPGIVGVAVLEALAIGLLYRWCSATVPR